MESNFGKKDKVLKSAYLEILYSVYTGTNLEVSRIENVVTVAYLTDPAYKDEMYESPELAELPESIFFRKFASKEYLRFSKKIQIKVPVVKLYFDARGVTSVDITYPGGGDPDKFLTQHGKVKIDIRDVEVNITVEFTTTTKTGEKEINAVTKILGMMFKNLKPQKFTTNFCKESLLITKCIREKLGLEEMSPLHKFEYHPKFVYGPDKTKAPVFEKSLFMRLIGALIYRDTIPLFLRENRRNSDVEITFWVDYTPALSLKVLIGMPGDIPRSRKIDLGDSIIQLYTYASFKTRRHVDPMLIKLSDDIYNLIKLK